MKSIPLLTKLQTFLSAPLELNLRRSIATDLKVHVLDLFHTVVNSVPAYRHFLQVHGIDPASIQSLSAFQQLPMRWSDYAVKLVMAGEVFSEEWRSLVGQRLGSTLVELAPRVDAERDKAQSISQSILEQLRRLNSEFANYVPTEYQQPQITLKPMGDPDFFPVGVKHSHTRSI